MVSYLKQHYFRYWAPHKEMLSHMYQEQQASALEYYLIKYPQKSKVYLNTEMGGLIKEKNDLGLPQFSIIDRLKIRFNPFKFEPAVANIITPADARELNYSTTLKHFINALIHEAKTWNEQFKTTMREIFTVTENQAPALLSDFALSMKFR